MKANDSISIPPSFWRKLSDEEWDDVFKCGGIRGEALKRLWKQLKRKDRRPYALQVMMNRDEFMQVFPEIKRDG